MTTVCSECMGEAEKQIHILQQMIIINIAISAVISELCREKGSTLGSGVERGDLLSTFALADRLAMAAGFSTSTGTEAFIQGYGNVSQRERKRQERRKTQLIIFHEAYKFPLRCKSPFTTSRSSLIK